MGTIIRLKAIPPSGFRHGGIAVGKAWNPFETAKLDATARETLEKFHGRFIMVHPEDHSKLAELGLKFVAQGEPLAKSSGGGKPSKPDPKTGDAKPPTPPSTPNSAAPGAGKDK